MLQDKIDKMVRDSEEILSQHPEITSLWFQFMDVPFDELQAITAKYDAKYEYNDTFKRMTVLLSCIWPRITCFCRSVPVEVQTTIVVKEAV